MVAVVVALLVLGWGLVALLRWDAADADDQPAALEWAPDVELLLLPSPAPAPRRHRRVPPRLTEDHLIDFGRWLEETDDVVGPLLGPVIAPRSEAPADG